jgi:kynurenine formamidase
MRRLPTPGDRYADISVVLDFHGTQPNAYDVPIATSRPYAGDGFTLDTRAGGSCNCDVVEVVPHCHGTHTECVGHLTRERFPVAAVMPEPFVSCTLITVEPACRAIGADQIKRATAGLDQMYCEAMAIRTRPNPREKAVRRWVDSTTPYFTPEAVSVIRARGVQHLLVDLPSLDPLRDGGVLAAHRVFWDLPPGSQEVPAGDARSRTVTELIYVPDDVPDGRYLLNLQLPRWVTDAAPSRPLLFFPDDG